jgi:hypothetical protein
VAAAVVRDGDRLDGRGSGEVATHLRLVA